MIPFGRLHSTALLDAIAALEDEPAVAPPPPEPEPEPLPISRCVWCFQDFIGEGEVCGEVCRADRASKIGRENLGVVRTCARCKAEFNPAYITQVYCRNPCRDMTGVLVKRRCPCGKEFETTKGLSCCGPECRSKYKSRLAGRMRRWTYTPSFAPNEFAPVNQSRALSAAEGMRQAVGRAVSEAG